MRSILIVEDNEVIIKGLTYLLEKENFHVIICKNVNETMNVIGKQEIHLIVLDIALPDGNGFELCEYIKKYTDIPVIFLTAKDEEDNIVKGLELGAEDYITKPFQPLELIARVKAQLRRYKKYNNQDNTINTNEIDFRGIRINNSTHEFFFNEKLVELTKTEFAILWELCANRGNVAKSDELFF